ncbi:hypothetical protein PRZ48_010022 [Zasmidium cellare]|uniref:Calcineurin-like phosphoesterase domain-containing protein n=1 Tax=Zasmidium cellare TaxID=395010 RepID=A0ABR0EDF6_ZASCE|nr:hypothetical protein PRZ48_010022 [Zasmidium cellare]
MRMRFRHHATQATRRITRRYPFLRYLSILTTILTCAWFYALYSSERSTFQSHIQACSWDKWEEWPHHATPHHLVFVADPQIVDPHTYPGRPWPLSSLTETYTDLYMTRNFRLINEKLDPDSVVFLGDLFDGGREWATSRARKLTRSQREILIKLGILKEGEKEGQKVARGLDGSDNGESSKGKSINKRSLDSYRYAKSHPHSRIITKEEHNIWPRDGKTDLREFVHGEDGRWSSYGDKQWNLEFERFGRIFFAPEQLYPNSDRNLVPAWTEPTDSVSVENGANDLKWEQYAVGGRHRLIKTSLPGNHDLGFGAGVQLPVRDRFQSHFGDTNSVYVIGNHTFVSVDGPSLSAFDEYVMGNEEISEERRVNYQHLWKPADEFLDDLSKTAPKVVADALNEYYPGEHETRGYWHEVSDPKDTTHQLALGAKAKKNPKLPVILLSHVPLFRNPDVDCGKDRERGRSIPIHRGYQYQNVLTPTVTNRITKKASEAGDIVHAFSGDDHDYCDITHRFNVGRWNEETNKEQAVMQTTREITVKSFSWAMGVRRPGFQLVSLWNPVDEMGNTVGTPLPTIQSHLCLLPDQLSIFINYVILLGWTLLILLIRAVVVGIRNKPLVDEEDGENDFPRKLSLPRYQPRSSSKDSGRANGYVSPNENQQNETQGRQRASSTSTSTANVNNNNLSVQRSYNSRTRSVSPAAASAGMNYNFNANSHALPNLQDKSRPLIEKAGFYPELRWQDPDDSDEESHVGEEQDSQAKWKKRKRTTSRARRAFNEFIISVAFVAIPCGLFYTFLIKNG